MPRKSVKTKTAGSKEKRATADPKQPEQPPVQPVVTRIGPGTTHTPRTLPASED